VKEPDCLDAVLLAKQVDRRLDKSPSVWTLALDVVATVDSTKVTSSVFSLKVRYLKITVLCGERPYTPPPQVGYYTSLSAAIM
jgi:hypothetical protein